jgi:hypothetical protein
MSCAATVGRFLPLDSVHELYRHNPYPRYRSCLAALRRCSSWSMLIIRRKEGHAADPSCHRRLFAHAHQPAICRFMSVEIKKHPANGLSSCPFGFCCACFMPWARPIDIFQATQASCPASRRCGGGKRADYCNSLLTYCYYSPCVPVARVTVQVAWCRCCCLHTVVLRCRLSASFSVPTNCFSLHVRSPFHKTFTVSLQLTPLHARRCAVRRKNPSVLAPCLYESAPASSPFLRPLHGRKAHRAELGK